MEPRFNDEAQSNNGNVYLQGSGKRVVTKGSGQNYFTCSGPTFGGGARQETMGLYRQVGGMGKRPWVCTDRWGDG